MTTLFETIAIKNGVILNLSYHNRRFVQGQKFLQKSPIMTDLAQLIDRQVDAKPDACHDLVRCRITYSQHSVHVSYFAYVPKVLQSFQLVKCDDICYDYKYDDRQAIEQLLCQKGNCDDIIIVKNGLITDCSIGNLLFLQNGQWFTPDTPLLKGTQRQFLLESDKIRLAKIGVNDVFAYEQVMMINAMNAFDESRTVAICKIVA